MLRTNDLSYRYPNSPPLQFPDLQVEEDRNLLILGESGCGKTTLLHLLAGLLRPKTGALRLNGTDYGQLRGARLDRFRGRHIGIVYQRAYFIESLRVAENLQISPFAQSDAVRSFAEELGIGHLLNKYPHELSVGERQRASIVRALAHRPSLLLADEPTSALDQTNCQRVSELLRRSAEATGATLIVVTHDDRLKPDFPQQLLLEPQTTAA